MKCVDCGACQKGWNESKPDKYYCLGVKEPFEIYDIYAECTEYPESETIEGCKYCQRDNNKFVTLNDTGEYSGIWMALNRQGMFRVRYFDDHDNLEAMDILNINFCPMCGRKLRDGGKEE